MINNKSECEVSIIMPVYNSIKYLRDSINDILLQRYKDFELICVDDGSTDGSGELLDKYSQEDARVKVIHQENAGGGSARNRGLDVARGKYILSLDSDDRFEPNLLEKVVTKIQETDADVVAFGGDSFDSKTGKHSSAPWLIKSTEEPSVENPLDVVNTTVWNKIYLKEHILKYNIRFQENMIVNNMYFVFFSVVYAGKVSIVSDVLVHYRINNSSSAISNVDKWPNDAYEALAMIYKKLVNDNMYDMKKAIFILQAADYLTSMLRMMKTDKGFIQLYNTIHEDRLNIINVELVKELEEKFEYGYLKDLQYIKEKSVEEYLCYKRKSLQDLGISRKETYVLPLKFQKTIRHLVIYGGGNVGKDYFLQIKKREDVELVGWVDRSYIELGYPIQSPDILCELDFDCIIISVLDRIVVDSIKKGLVEKGIPEEKIYWEKPIVL